MDADAVAAVHAASEAEHRCDVESMPVRFVAVCFASWLADLERAMLRRALRPLLGGRAGGDADAWAHMPTLVVVEEHGGVQEVVAVGGECDFQARHVKQPGDIRIGMTLTQAQSTVRSEGDSAPRSGDCLRIVEAIAQLRASGGACRQRRYGAATFEASGLLAGRSWSDRIVCVQEHLIAIRSDPEICRRVLGRLARCLERWIPVVGAPDGDSAGSASSSRTERLRPVLVGDFTGCARLFRRRFRGERELMERMSDNFRRRGFGVQVATASTIGAAIAVARWSTPGGRASHDAGCIAVAHGAEARALAALPVESLRVSRATVDALAAVGVETIGQLDKLGRAGIAARLSGQSCEEHAPAGQEMRAERSAQRKRGSRSTASRAASAGATLFDSGEEPSSIPSIPSRLVASASRARDVLLRLDQAYGSVPEMLQPLRPCEPLVLRHDFESPCVDHGAIGLACSRMLERLLRTLHGRKEALRRAVWLFRHAELPHDLSTDRAPVILLRTPARCATTQSAPPMSRESSITLAPVRPSAGAAHLWSILHPALQRIALDHGVESIACTLEQSVRRRVRQHRLSLSGPAEVSAGGRDEWIDLVRARIGHAAVVPWSPDASRSCSPIPIRRPAHRPSVWFHGGEPAFLQARCDADAIACSIARRVPWSFRHRSDEVSSAMAVEGPARISWRGREWRLRAIDGWERSVPPWWDDGGRSGRIELVLAGGTFGTVCSRVQVEDGLWLFVLWPAQLPSSGIPASGVVPDSVADHTLRRMSLSISGTTERDDGGRGVELRLLGAWS